MAAESAQGNEIELAEKPRENESWKGMVERQQTEGSNRGGYLRGLQRSLPDEQKEEKDRGGSGNVFMPNDQSPLMVEAEQQSYQDLLRDVSQRAGQDQNRGIDR